MNTSVNCLLWPAQRDRPTVFSHRYCHLSISLWGFFLDSPVKAACCLSPPRFRREQFEAVDSLRGHRTAHWHTIQVSFPSAQHIYQGRVSSSDPGRALTATATKHEDVMFFLNFKFILRSLTLQSLFISVYYWEVSESHLSFYLPSSLWHWHPWWSGFSGGDARLLGLHTRIFQNSFTHVFLLMVFSLEKNEWFFMKKNSCSVIQLSKSWWPLS